MSQNAAARRYAFEVCEVLNSKRTPQAKLGAICRLTRVHKKIAGTDLARKLGCSASRAYLLETGASKDLDGYGRLLDALGLDREAVLRLVIAEAQAVEPAQVEHLLLDATARSDAASPATGSPAALEMMQAAFLKDALAVLQADWSKTRKIGEICRIIRQHHKLTQRAVGIRLGHSNMYVSTMENGQMHLDRYPALLRALGLDHEALFEIVDAGPTAGSIAAIEALFRVVSTQPAATATSLGNSAER